jgi:hypothetical protein
LRARLFLRDEEGGSYGFACELDAGDADDVWRQLEMEPHRARRGLRPGDIVFIADLYLELDGDGGWRRIAPGPLTRQLYELVSASERRRP